ncbi:MAG: hypothetical protein R3310_11530, partial [Candidatus Competibacteraceae bacterium]|nr:hypothetical protein [Candidatus Competibacteraceae bacterium]
MAIELNQRHTGTGTRFKLFAQPPFLEGFEAPETVWVSIPPERIGPGPADERMYVVYPREEVHKSPYEFPYLPPYLGPAHPPLEAGGHFDHLQWHPEGGEQGQRHFRAAHLYGSMRRLLDTWETYLGRSFPWHFAADYDRLELIPRIDWTNAQSGYGFIETGYGNESGICGGRPYRKPHDFCLNYDVLAHEFGHSLLFAQLAMPHRAEMTAEYLGLHEAYGDCVALVSVLHFDRFIDYLLDSTRGNLYT